VNTTPPPGGGPGSRRPVLAVLRDGPAGAARSREPLAGDPARAPPRSA